LKNNGTTGPANGSPRPGKKSARGSMEPKKSEAGVGAGPPRRPGGPGRHGRNWRFMKAETESFQWTDDGIKTYVRPSAVARSHVPRSIGRPPADKMTCRILKRRIEAGSQGPFLNKLPASPPPGAYFLRPQVPRFFQGCLKPPRRPREPGRSNDGQFSRAALRPIRALPPRGPRRSSSRAGEAPPAIAEMWDGTLFPMTIRRTRFFQGRRLAAGRCRNQGDPPVHHAP